LTRSFAAPYLGLPDARPLPPCADEMPLRTPLLALLAGALAAACAPCPPDVAPAPHPGAPPAGLPVTESPLVSSLQVEPFPDSVRFVLQVTNAGEAPETLTFPTGQLYDFAVHAHGAWLWRWSAEMGFTQAVQEVTLAAGETLTFMETWRPPADAPEVLAAVAWLTSSSHPVEQSASFRLH
jgi:hypothetical protein